MAWGYAQKVCWPNLGILPHQVETKYQMFHQLSSTYCEVAIEALDSYWFQIVICPPKRKLSPVADSAMDPWPPGWNATLPPRAIQRPGENQWMYIWFMTFMKIHMCSHSKSLTLKPQNLALCNGHGETQQFEGRSSGFSSAKLRCFALLGWHQLIAFRVDQNSSCEACLHAYLFLYVYTYIYYIII